MNEYLKQFSANSDATKALVVLPDIWSQTAYSASTAVELTRKFEMPVYILDYFYQLTGKTNNFNPQTDQAIAKELMNEITGEDFMNIFNKAMHDIKSNQPRLESVAVIGFCFGGRLAYLSGMSDKVKKIAAFYGTGVYTANYFKGKTPIDALLQARQADQGLSIISFYGSHDASIPAEVRAQTVQSFKNAGINYIEKVYDAGHAYFQPGRDGYIEKAALQSWQELDSFIKNY